MIKCECCGKETPERDIFRYENHKVCGICYVNIEEYRKYSQTQLVLTKSEINKIQLRNEQETFRIKKLDFSVFPREFLEELLNFLRKNNFMKFKEVYIKFEQIKR